MGTSGLDATEDVHQALLLLGGLSIDSARLDALEAEQVRAEHAYLRIAYEDGKEGEGEDADSTIGLSVTCADNCTWNGNCKKRSRTSGSFEKHEMNVVVLPSKTPGGKPRKQIHGMKVPKVPMDETRLSKVVSLMNMHNNFATDADLNSSKAIKSYARCLMILDGLNMDSRYPSYVSEMFGDDKFFSSHHDIKPSAQDGARDFLLELFASPERLGRQTIGRVKATEAAPQKRDQLVNKLVGSHMLGLSAYLNCLQKLNDGTIRLPVPETSIPSLDSPGSSIAFSGSVFGHVNVLADPSSPCAAFRGSCPGLQSGSPRY